MPDLSANPLRYPCPTCGVPARTVCHFPDAPFGVHLSHTARFPDEPSRSLSDRCDCGDPMCPAHGPSEAEPGFAQTMETMTRQQTAHDRQGD